MKVIGLIFLLLQVSNYLDMFFEILKFIDLRNDLLDNATVKLPGG